MSTPGERAHPNRQALADWSSSDKTSSEGEARRVSAGSANQFHQFVTPDTGRKFTELYNVQHLTSNHLDPVARVTICTIHRLYAMLRSFFCWLNKRMPLGQITRGDRPRLLRVQRRVSITLL